MNEDATQLAILLKHLDKEDLANDPGLNVTKAVQKKVTLLYLKFIDIFSLSKSLQSVERRQHQPHPPLQNNIKRKTGHTKFPNILKVKKENLLLLQHLYKNLIFCLSLNKALRKTIMMKWKL